MNKYISISIWKVAPTSVIVTFISYSFWIFADERGTREYNLALGQRRSESVSSYLIASGLSNSRMEAISYGEERPLILGSEESSWQKNRRVEIK